MKIVSTTITGNREKTIRRALESVKPLVSKCILIDTGITDDTLKVAREVCGKKLLVREFPWCDDFGAARNFALHCAEEAGADWAFTVDSDEIMLPRPDFSLRRALSDPGCRVLYTYNAPGIYYKERVLKLKSGLKWHGCTHEYLLGVTHETTYLTTNMVFDEVPKGMEAMKAKLDRDIRLLSKMIQTDPKNPRWPFYMGATLQNLGDHERAISYHLQAMRLSDWEEDGERAADLIRKSYVALNRFDEGIALFKQRLLSNPGTTYLYAFVKGLELQRDEFAAKSAVLN